MQVVFGNGRVSVHVILPGVIASYSSSGIVRVATIN
jgi:hypothetical protein